MRLAGDLYYLPLTIDFPDRFRPIHVCNVLNGKILPTYEARFIL